MVVRTGKDKGKSGEVLKVLPKENRAIVQGVNMVKRHTRPPDQAGGIVELEASMHISNLAIVDPKTGEPTRVGFKFLDDNRKVVSPSGPARSSTRKKGPRP